MPQISDMTRNKLIALMQRRPADVSLNQANDGLLDETRQVLSVAFAELGYQGKFRISRNPGTSGSVPLWEEARWLLIEGGKENPEETVWRLEQLVTRNEVILERVEAVWGLHPDRPIQLSDELTLTPLTNLRPSSARNTLLEADSVKPALTQQPRPRAAIVHKFVHRPLYFRDGETAAPFTWDDKHFLSDLCLVHTLLNDSPVVRVAEWYQADTSVPVVGIDSGWAGSFAEPRITQEIAPQSYDEELARKIISGFLRLSPLDRRRLTISLRRLNLAGLREMSSDIALELGIALEALLSEPGDPQDSISYRLKMRAAILLGGPINQREQTARQVSQLYGLRSAAAHGADLDGHWRGLERIEVGKKKYTGQELADTFRNGRQLCGRIARKILQLGEFPSFNRMLLGEQPASDED